MVVADDVVVARVKQKLDHLLDGLPMIKKVLNNLSSEGDLLLFGGTVRDFLLNDDNAIPRDIDIVVDTTNEDLSCYFEKCNFTRNRFGGYKVTADGMTLDIWNLHSTWAFKNCLVTEQNQESLPSTVFLNFDSIVYNMNKGSYFENGFLQGVERRMLDIVLEDNPFPDLNVIRALVLKRKYNLLLSRRLRDYIQACIKRHDRYTERLLDIQKSHYGKEHVVREDIQKELAFLL